MNRCDINHPIDIEAARSVFMGWAHNQRILYEPRRRLKLTSATWTLPDNLLRPKAEYFDPMTGDPDISTWTRSEDDILESIHSQQSSAATGNSTMDTLAG